MIKRPKGTNDILPDISYRWNFLESTIHNIAKNFGFHEIRTPIFEHTELFTHGVGDATDIVEKEMYTFVDRGGRSLALRPEGTASVVRAYLEHSLHKKEERLKVYYIGPMFRYEKPQAGRFRQHHQFGLEIFGESSPLADVEVISLVYELYRQLGIKNIRININSVGCDCRSEFIEVLKKFLEINLDKLCDDCHRRYYKNPLRVFDCKNSKCQGILSEAPKGINYICNTCREHLDGVLHGLDILGIPYEIIPTLVRGLDYYTNTVFEVVSETLGAQNAIGGGGRYNNLIKSLGGPAIPAVGFAAGLERILLTMDNEDITIKNPNIIDIRVISIGETAKEVAFRMCYDLRRMGINTDMDYREKSLKAQLRNAGKHNDRFVIIIGEDELKDKSAILRNMETKEEKRVSINDIKAIRDIVKGNRS